MQYWGIENHIRAGHNFVILSKPRFSPTSLRGHGLTPSGMSPIVYFHDGIDGATWGKNHGVLKRPKAINQPPANHAVSSTPPWWMHGRKTVCKPPTLSLAERCCDAPPSLVPPTSYWLLYDSIRLWSRRGSHPPLASDFSLCPGQS